jgi:hypothetical protein
LNQSGIEITDFYQHQACNKVLPWMVQFGLIMNFTGLVITSETKPMPQNLNDPVNLIDKSIFDNIQFNEGQIPLGPIMHSVIFDDTTWPPAVGWGSPKSTLTGWLPLYDPTDPYSNYHFIIRSKPTKFANYFYFNSFRLYDGSVEQWYDI